MYYAVGSAIVTPKEFSTKMQSGEINQFFGKLSRDQMPAPVKFSTGELNLKTVVTPEFVKAMAGRPVAAAATREMAAGAREVKPDTLPPNVIPFTQIGPGKPLTIMIRAVYTGEHPGRIIPGQKIGMLVSSAVRTFISKDVEAQPKAVNYLLDEVKSYSYLNRPAASSTGTPIVYYSPAILEDSLTIEISIIFDKFPEDAFNSMGQIMQGAGGIPAFLPYSTFMLTMGTVTKIVGKIGEKLFDGSAQFSANEGLDICMEGVPATPSGYTFIFGRDMDKIEPNWRRKFHIGISPNNDIIVVDEKDQEYRGDVPYVILSYDGKARDTLKSFTPTAASAAILSRFYGMKDGESQTKLFDTFTESYKLYNDLKLRKQIDVLKKANEGLPDEDQTKKNNLERIKALESNIQTEEMKYK